MMFASMAERKQLRAILPQRYNILLKHKQKKQTKYTFPIQIFLVYFWFLTLFQFNNSAIITFFQDLKRRFVKNDYSPRHSVVSWFLPSKQERRPPHLASRKRQYPLGLWSLGSSKTFPRTVNSAELSECADGQQVAGLGVDRTHQLLDECGSVVNLLSVVGQVGPLGLHGQLDLLTTAVDSG